MKPRSLPISAEERERLAKGLSASVYAKEEEQKKKERELHDAQVAREAAGRKMKETVLQASEVSEWQKEERRLEVDGLDTRQPETVAMGGERRTDWDPMRK